MGRGILDRWILCKYSRARGSEETIRKYVQEQGIEKEYRRLHYDEQLKLF